MKLLNKIFLIIAVSLFAIGFTNHAFAQYDDKLVVLNTNHGSIIIDFFPDDAPNHVENFIKLTESGYYDDVLFHRIIPDFMIQGGDPNTIDGDPSTWGTGGPATNLDAEFNNIKHNRGIVSMARAQDPNSAGSQFFIVHKDANFLDGQYTVFGRIATEESFATLDKIAAVETNDRDAPLDPQYARILSVLVLDEANVPDLLELDEPQRIDTFSNPNTSIPPPVGDTTFESVEHDIKFDIPEGWLLQELDNTDPNAPDMVALGPTIGNFPAAISLSVEQTNGQTLDEIVAADFEILKEAIEGKILTIISQEDTTIIDNESHSVVAESVFDLGGQPTYIKFEKTIIYDEEKYYVFTYFDDKDDFDTHLPQFTKLINSIEIISEPTASTDAGDIDTGSSDENGGCLIATATFGSELAPQVQQLRELRDNTILSTESGTAFMNGFNQFYYSFSPMIADLERENPLFKEIVRLSITPMLTTLSILNHVEVNSEAEMISVGLSIIMLNVGMYFVAPAAIIYKIRR